MPDESGTQTLRQQMVVLLEGEECRVRDISQALHMSEKAVGDHLGHIRRSLSGSRQTLVIRPSACLACGFVFKERRRFTRPGRCPRCRQTRISMPRFRIDGPS